MDAFGLFTGQIGYAWNNALLYVKGGAAVTDIRYDSIFNATARWLPRPVTTPIGAAPSVPASNTASPELVRGRRIRPYFPGLAKPDLHHAGPASCWLTLPHRRRHRPRHGFASITAGVAGDRQILSVRQALQSGKGRLSPAFCWHCSPLAGAFHRCRKTNR